MEYKYKKLFEEYKKIISIILSNEIFLNMIYDNHFYSIIIKILSIMKFLILKIENDLNDWWIYVLNINVFFNIRIDINQLIECDNLDLVEQINIITSSLDILLMKQNNIMFMDLDYVANINDNAIIPIVDEYLIDNGRQLNKFRKQKTTINTNSDRTLNKEIIFNIVDQYKHNKDYFIINKNNKYKFISVLIMLLKIFCSCSILAMSILLFVSESNSTFKTYSFVPKLLGIIPLMCGIYGWYNIIFILKSWVNEEHRYKILIKNEWYFNRFSGISYSVNSEIFIIILSYTALFPCCIALFFLHYTQSSLFLSTMILFVLYIIGIVICLLLYIFGSKFNPKVNNFLINNLYIKYYDEKAGVYAR